MGSFDIQHNAPGLLRSESLNITFKFERNGPTTGRVSWNIPTPGVGCTADTQAYCGMLVCLDTQAASAASTPAHGTVYSSDSNVTPDVFAGDTIGSAMVVGGFYQDRTTVTLNVTGLSPTVTYYASGYPMDCMGRYFLDGVHAYAPSYSVNHSDGTSGTQVVFLNEQTKPVGVTEHDVTGLVIGEPYQFEIQQGLDPKPERALRADECVLKAPRYTIEVNGADAPTYGDLVAAINTQFAALESPNMGATPPNTGAYYLNTTQRKLYQWDGYALNELPMQVSTSAPNTPVVGAYWNNGGALSVWNGLAWDAVTTITTPYDPANPPADIGYWYDGTTAYVWNGITWCAVHTVVSVEDPMTTTQVVPGSYWYNPAAATMYKWNAALGIWMVVDYVEYSTDPSTLPNGALWFDLSTNTLYAYNSPQPGWNPINNVSLTEHAPSFPAEGKYWFKPLSKALYQWNSTTMVWVELEAIVSPNQPTPSTCSLWWNTTTNTLNVRDILTNTWVPVSSFFQTSTDPTEPTAYNPGAAWYNPTTQTLSVFQDGCFVGSPVTITPTNPLTSIPVGTAHYNGTTWRIRSVSGWTNVTPVSTNVDPYAPTLGTFWYNPTTQTLTTWNGVTWTGVGYSSQLLTPQKGTKWYNTTNNTLYVWSGASWTKTTPRLLAELDCNGNLKFTDTSLGSTSFVNVQDITLFDALTPTVKINVPSPGTDGVSGEPSYAELGVGTDGSSAMRDQMAMEIRYELGYPVVDVEVTKEQMDYAITRALSELRQRSGIAYKRGFFFMGVKANEQKFLLTNKISNMNKIVDVMGVYRVTSAFLSSAHGAGVYGQIVMQHMYNMGTFDLLSYHLMGEYTKLLETLFAARITYTWNEQTRELYIHHKFPLNERMVAIEATVERTEQEIMSDRYAQPWIRRYAAAMVRLMLAETRGKFASLPGAGGSITLNSSELRQAARDEIQACLDEIDSYVADKPEEYGSGVHFVFG